MPIELMTSAAADIPAPEPNVVPLPTPSHPVPPSPATPPEIQDPIQPGQAEPVREPPAPSGSGAAQ